ncbi:alpha/beta fold hydrolase [Coleofasciculus sp. E1-EBD-02]|uniref:alpha/beta fold hydrolase n=1 Tax=Coleofasciculus sp. E1-EBD-02 TaxID=3068481 RepID=UPI0032FEE12E
MMPELKSHPYFLKPRSPNPDYPLFVYLPGMDGTGQLLRSQIPNLAAAFDVRCLVIPPHYLSNWQDLANQVASLIATELSQRRSQSVYLCGESFGGCLALKVALTAPHLLHRIILSNPATSVSQPSWLLWGSQWLGVLPDNVYHLSTLTLLPILSSLNRMIPSNRRALLEAMRSLPAKTMHWRVSMLRNFKVDPAALEPLTQPVLILASAADRLWCSLAEAKSLVNYLPNATMSVLPKSGHACLLETDVNLFEILNHQNFLDLSVPQSEIEPDSSEIIRV